MEIGGQAQPYSLLMPGTVVKQGTVLTSLAKAAVKISDAVPSGLKPAMENVITSDELNQQQATLYQVLLQLWLLQCALACRAHWKCHSNCAQLGRQSLIRACRCWAHFVGPDRAVL